MKAEGHAWFLELLPCSCSAQSRVTLVHAYERKMDLEALLKAAASLSPELVGLLLNLAQVAPHEQQSKLQAPADARIPDS